MYRNVHVPLQIDECDALAGLAAYEKRDSRYQAAFIIRRELERLGYIQPLQMEAANVSRDTQPA